MKNFNHDLLIKNIINYDTQSKDFSGIFDILSKQFDFLSAYITFFNPDSILIKYSYPHTSSLQNEKIPISEQKMNELFNSETEIIEDFNELKKALNVKKNENVLIYKLLVKNTVYGALIFIIKNSCKITEELKNLLSVISAILSYKIKDNELSDIFKQQLKALQENYIKTKNDYKDIEYKNKKILESDKVKSEFLANVTHELRTPLNAIIGFSEILKTKLLGDLNAKQEEYVDDIYISGVHLLGMINEILDISKIESNAMTLNKSRFEISRAVDEVINVILPLSIKKDIILTKNIEDKEVFADFQKIKQILYNLVSNAIKFTPKCGKIDITVNSDKKWFYVKVKDTGIGIEKSLQEKIFDKFVQLENAYVKTESGTGLGLAITKNFVEMHNGTISLKSTPKKGSEFTIKLPLK